MSISGTITSYHGQLQLEPTAQTTLQTGATPPPVYMATAADLGETANSPYRGVYVKFPSQITVDNVTPAGRSTTRSAPRTLEPTAESPSARVARRRLMQASK